MAMGATRVDLKGLDKLIPRLTRICLWFWALLPLLGVGLYIRSEFSGKKSLEAARTLPVAEREAILLACVKHARGEVVARESSVDFSRSGRDIIPSVFDALHPLTVRLDSHHASIALHHKVQISCTGLDTNTPSAELSWGGFGRENGGKEIWAEIVVPSEDVE